MAAVTAAPPTPSPDVVLPPITLGDPAQLDLTAYRGDTGRFRVLVTQDGAALDVSQAVWDCDVRTSADEPVLASMTVTPVAGTTNAVDVELVAGSTATMAGGDYVWDLEMTLGTDPNPVIVTTLLRGKLTLTADVSRAVFSPPPTDGSTTQQGAGAPGALPFRPDPGPLVVHGIEDSGHTEAQP